MDKLSEYQRTRILKSLEYADESYFQIDPDLGWRITPAHDKGTYKSNLSGYRITPEPKIGAALPKLRIATFGDSYTHGDGVHNDQTWQYYLQLENRELKVYNFGVSGYGIDQSYLHYQERWQVENFDLVFISFMSKDLFDVVNNFRPFQLPGTGLPFAKPRYELSEDGELELHPPPLQSKEDYEKLLQDTGRSLRSIGQNDLYFESHWAAQVWDVFNTYQLIKLTWDTFQERVYDYGILRNGLYQKNTEAYRITLSLLQSFSDQVIANGARPVIIFLPNKSDIINSKAGLAPSYQTLYTDLMENGYETWDCTAAFREADAASVNTGHYTPYGNKLIGSYLAKQLAQNLNLDCKQPKEN